MPTFSFEGHQENVAASIAPMITPLVSGGIPGGSGEVVLTALKAIFVRCIVPFTGVLKDVAVLNGVVKGETNVGVYDTGDAAAGSYTLLGESGPKTQTGQQQWQSMGACGGPVLNAGQQVMLAVMDSEAGQIVQPLGQLFNELPTGYLTVPGGALPKPVGTHTFAENKFVTITEAELATAKSKGAMLIGRTT